MSHWISLVDKTGKLMTVEPFKEGGTHPIHGSTEADLNITYNYSQIYELFDFKIENLHGKKAIETIPILAILVQKLGTNKYKDYWAPTPGNAGYALSILLKWAGQYPNGIWKVS